MAENKLGEDKMIVAVIPCRDEAQTVGEIIAEAKRFVNKVIVCDDGSLDGTKDIAIEAGAMVIRSENRQGFGGTLKAGVSVALHEGADVVVTIDGDGQHNPREIPLVAKEVRARRADLVIGSRFLRGHSCPRYRKFGIDIITWLYNIGYGQKISDAQSCFRAYSRELLETIMLEDDSFGFSVEVLVKARRRGFRITEVPVSCIYHRDFRMNSSMNPVLQGLIVLLALARWRLRRRER